MIRRRGLRRRGWMGSAARRRVQAGGPLAVGRKAGTLEQWREIRHTILARARSRCEACGRAGRLDVHHLVKRSQGGGDADPDQLVALCRRCHELTDAPYATGRLVITALGTGRFQFEVVTRRADGGSGRESRTVVPTTEAFKALLNSKPGVDPAGLIAEDHPRI